MKIKISKRVLTGFFVAAAVVMAVAPSQPANAAGGGRANGQGYFTGQFTRDVFWGDVLPGGIPNSNSKATFESFIIGTLNGNPSGSERQRAAAFIIQLMRGVPGASANPNPTAGDIADWQARIDQPSVSLSLENYSFNTNTAYAHDINDPIFYGEADTKYSLVFRYNGAIVMVIKQDCANPLDDLPGIPPPPPPTSALQGYILEENTGTQISGRVTVQGLASVSQNPFFFDGGPGHGPRVPSGAQTMNVDSLPAGYVFVGSTICGGSSPCGPGQPSSSTSGQNFSTLGLRSWNFEPGVTYDMRWIVRKSASLSCVTPTINPAAVEPTTAYQVTVSANVSPPGFAAFAAAGATATISVLGPGVNYNTTVPVTASGNTLTATVTPGPTNNTGTYLVFFNINSPLGSVPCGTAITPATTFPVADYPYFSVLGGDVKAGAGFGPSCTEDASAGIRAYNRGAVGNFKGSGTELAAFARSTITGFATGTNPPTGTATSNTTRPGGLAFSNTDPAALGNFGSLGCAPDYSNDAINGGAAVTTDNTATSVDVSTLASGVYVFSGGGAPVFAINPGGPGVVGNGKRITIIVNGDVVIRNNISYAPYANLSVAPSLTIIANGYKLHISSNVLSMSGFFVAQGTGGIISTCSTPAGANWIESIDPSGSVCGRSLVINGALSGASIHFNRTSGSLAGPAAETIQFSPELWAASLLNCGGDIRLCSQTDDYVVSLPPIL